MPRSLLDPLDILRICAVPDHPGVFILPTVERPTRIVSQQRRALNLVHALYECGAIRKRGLGVIGGGFGGLTAAAYAAVQGSRATVLDKSTILRRFSNSMRYVHPRLYDWPYEGWNEKDAALPVLNWKAGPAREVARNVISQFSFACSNLRARVEEGVFVESPSSEGDSVWLRWRKQGETQRERFDVVIIAIGFGDEYIEPNYPHKNMESYWDIKVPASEQRFERNSIIRVTGNGDGALADLIGLAVMTTTGNVREYLGDYVQLIKKLEPIRKEYLELENKYRNIVARGDLPNEKRYEQELEQIVTSIRKNEFERPPVRQVIIKGRKNALFDIRGTFPANRVLLKALYGADQLLRYGDETDRQGKQKQWHNTVDSDRDWIGPFFKPVLQDNHPASIENAWYLHRHGPANVLDASFPQIGELVKGASWRNRLQLTERPILPASWSQRASWVKEFQPNQRLPRLVLATDWVDSIVQRSLASRDQRNSRRLFRGILRIHALLFDEINVTDASIMDGSLLAHTLSSFHSVETKTFSVAARAPTLKESLVRFLTDFSGSGNEVSTKAVELSCRKGAMIRPRPIKAKSLNRIFAEISKQKRFGKLISNASVGEELLGDRIRLINRVKLPSIPPQFGILEHQDISDFASEFLPFKEGEMVPTRSIVFEHLRKCASVKRNHDLFSSLDAPQWLSRIATWYNAGYNSTIARNNGATAFEVHWVNAIKVPKKHLKLTNLNLAAISKVDPDEWLLQKAKVQQKVEDWKCGRITLVEVMGALDPCFQSSCVEGMIDSGFDSIDEAFDSAVNAENVLVGEIYNNVGDLLSPNRAILIGVPDHNGITTANQNSVGRLISTVLIEN